MILLMVLPNGSGNDPPARFHWVVGVHFPGWYFVFSASFIYLSTFKA
jgi:hypothetical protein